MSVPNEDNQTVVPTPDKWRTNVPWIFAGIIILGYCWFIIYLVGETGEDENKWTKLTYLFGSVEAIVFTAVGFIFGREVNKSRAVTAEKNEKKAKKEKKELAKEVLDRIPKAPGTPRDLEGRASDDNLRSMAERALID